MLYSFVEKSESMKQYAVSIEFRAILNVKSNFVYEINSGYYRNRIDIFILKSSIAFYLMFSRFPVDLNEKRHFVFGIVCKLGEI